VKPHARRNKNDAADAEAIREAVRRPNMRFAPVRTVENHNLSFREFLAEIAQMLKLAAYGEAIRARTANLPPKEVGYVRLTFVGLQQRLLSSIAAFAKTLDVHRRGVVRADFGATVAAAEASVLAAYFPQGGFSTRAPYCGSIDRE
jgi:transposase